MNSGDGLVRIGAVSKLGALEEGSCCSLGRSEAFDTVWTTKQAHPESANERALTANHEAARR
jgi:hypothetical protein